ncbi:MAG: ASCH domain-containing protein [Lachnospiraceae bacterium]|jgi:predicted transcriptional regulator|nr:ASCH domain-containing protein [Lachnospiraceae bacterium]
MCAILLSINPIHVEKIMNGTKRYEFRKRACKRQEDRILIYSTNPISKVVGEAEVEDILIDDPETIWRRTEKKSGINKHFFDKYFENREHAVAYKLKNVKRYVEPRELKEYGIRTAPQSFQYIEVS